MRGSIIDQLRAKAKRDKIEGLDYVQLVKAAKEVVTNRFKIEIEQLELEIEIESQKATELKIKDLHRQSHKS